MLLLDICLDKMEVSNAGVVCLNRRVVTVPVSSVELEELIADGYSIVSVKVQNTDWCLGNGGWV